MKDGLGEQVLPCHKEQNALLSSASKGLVIYLNRQREPTPLVSQLINLLVYALGLLRPSTSMHISLRKCWENRS